MKDSPRRLLCGFLALVFLFNMLPVSVLAEVIGEMDADATVAPVTDPEDVYVVDEIIESRTEYTKEFQLSNGLRLASVYSEPIHYDVNGEWAEIDNTLQTDNTRSEAAYTNTAGDWRVSFPQNLSSDNGVTISKNGFTLNFRMTGELHGTNIEPVDAEAVAETEDTTIENTEVVETESELDNIEADSEAEADGAVTLSVSAPAEMVTAAIEAVDMSEMQAAVDYPEVVVEKNASRVRYENIYENTDIIFDLVSNRVKESVVLRSFCDSLHGYTYELNTGEMIPVLMETGEIELRDPESEQAVMHMPAPFLMDYSGMVSYDIDVDLTGSNGTYELKYTLPHEWLAEEERQWPVTLDPIVTYVSNNSTAEDETFYQMYESSSNGSIMNCGYYSGIGCARTFLKFTDLPALTSADIVVSAAITLSACIKEGTTPAVVEVREVTETWSKKDSNKLWDNQPAFSSVVEDFDYCTTAQVLTWEITDLVRKWYAGTNYGMVFKISDANEAAKVKNYISFHTPLIYAQPALTIIYRNNNGLESYWDYTTTSAGRAGTGYVNQYTGNLVWVHEDIGFGGNRMPVSISHIYNANDTAKKPFGMGYGWRTNFNQKVYSINSNYYAWEDADGTVHYFLKSGTNTFKDEDGLELTLTTNGTDTNKKYAITDKYGNASYFDSSGRLSAQENNQQVKSSISITYTSGGLISKITDGVGRAYNFTYSNNLLSKISYVGTGTSELSKVSYSYSDSNLTSITYADGSKSNFTYSTSTRLLLTAQDADGYRLRYAYAQGVPRRVSTIKEQFQVAESGEILDANLLNITYAHNQITCTDHNGNVQITQFNSWGNTISRQDNQGRAEYAQYSLNKATESPSGTKKGNQLLLSSKMQNTVVNLLDDSSFEHNTNWAPRSTDVTCVNSNDTPYIGGQSLKMTRAANGSISGIKGPAVSIPAGSTYTFSAFIKTETGTTRLGITDETTTVYSENIASNGDWTRAEVSYTNTGTAAVSIYPLVDTEEAGTTYIDCVQVEKAVTASRYNLIQNGDFRTTTRWSSNSGRTTAASAGITKASAPQLDSTIYKLVGNPTAKVRLYQIIQVSGNQNDTFVLAGWSKANSAALYDHDGNSTTLNATEYAVLATVTYTDNSTKVFKAQFNPDMSISDDWQYSATAIVAEKDYKSIKIELAYDYNINTAYFDGIQLFKEEFGSSYAYDEKGNIVSVTDLQDQTTTNEYDNNNLTEQTLPNGVVLTYRYDDFHNVIEATSTTNLEYLFTYDGYGNNTSVSIVSGDQTLTSTATYSDNGNLLESTTDAAGNVTTYTYNEQTNELVDVIYPNNTENTKTSYEYDELYRLTSASMTVKAGQTLSANYGYTNNLLTNVSTGSTTYNFAYETFSLRDNISIGDRILASYTYTNDRNKYLSRLDYGNGDNVEYNYDGYGRVTKQTYEDNDIVTYKYDNTGALATTVDSATGITTTYYYDLTDRLMKTVEAATEYSHSVLYGYNTLNNLTTITDTINGTEYTTEYTYDTDNRVTSVSTGSTQESYVYDGFSRITQKETKTGDATVLTESYEYRTLENGAKTTGQVSKLTVDAATDIIYDYAYDANGNITSVACGGQTTSYVYDAANQLIRENNQAAGKTWIWEYDNAGNIVCRKEYSFTTALNPSNPIDTVNYSYNDDNWGDLLTSYDGQPIYSDEIGNVTTDGTWVYSWEHGRQLATMHKTNDSHTSVSLGVEYTYNADGLRTEKSLGSYIRPHFHGFTITTVGATCTEPGYKEHSCNCGYAYRDEHTPALGHNYKGKICTRCGYQLPDFPTPGMPDLPPIVASEEDIPNSEFEELEVPEYDAQAVPNASQYNETIRYSYVYTGDKLAQMTICEQPNSATPVEDTLTFAYDASGAPMTVNYNDTTYYYVTNLQGDVVGILDGTGASVVSYTYDAWGKILSTTGSLASTLGSDNPLRYRGYVYDNETGLYYLKSRYYNPEMGRFINADAFTSTGQGFLGNNMFSYCLNNPLSYSDFMGCWGVPSGISNPNAMTYKGGEYMGWIIPDIERKAQEDAAMASQAMNPFNTDEQVVIDADYFAFYKGQIVIKGPFYDNSAFSCGVIFMDSGIRNTNLLRHEYGHTQQLRQVGGSSYLSYVVFPSTVCFWLTEGNVLPGELYYSLPWEYKANELGHASGTYAPWASTVADIYWAYVMTVSYLL